MLGTITSVQTSESAIALTFDDGPDSATTPQVLEVLESHGARGTFFVVGKRAECNPELIKRIANAGHAIGNHSWSHISLPTVSGKERRAEIRACAKALGKYGQRILRPPYGHQSLASRLDAFWLGHTVVAWNQHARDWKEISAENMIELLNKELRPGNIILLHDTLKTGKPDQDRNREQLLLAVDRFLSQHKETYKFLTVPELLKTGRPVRSNWYPKGDPKWLADRKKAQQ